MKRIARIKEYLEQHDLDCALVYKPENRKYLSNFSGSSGYVLITKEEAIFATDFRYAEQAARECEGYTIKIIDNEYTITSLLNDLKLRRIGLEEDWATLSFNRSIIGSVPGAEVVFIEHVIKKMRMRKDEAELECIRRACRITDDAFTHILQIIRPGITEREISTEIQYFMKKQGAEATPDTFIIATGVRSSLPHGKATDKIVEMGDFVTMDIGCRYKGYWSDMTRTVVVGKASDEQRKIYGIVYEAQKMVNEALKPGMPGLEADMIAREYISEAGYGQEFGHGLGHGLGMEMHELPRLAQNEAGTIMLEPGMVVTNEPGIYIENFGGVRIEDDVVITGNGCEILCSSIKELIELD